MNRFIIGLTAAAIAFSSAHALQEPKGGARDDRVKIVTYDPANVVKIVGVVRTSTQVQFAEDEEIAHVAIGDSVAWEVAPAGNILFLKPREKHPPTNLQVVTTKRDGRKRSYNFELSIREGGSIGVGTGSYFMVRFSYPGDEAAQREAERRAQAEVANAQTADNVIDFHAAYGPRNWSYSAQGTNAIEPAAVYDDGKSTYFRFEGNMDIPSIYLVSTDGSENLVPKDVRGELVVVHAIGPQFVLRRGGDALCIFNEAYNPQGINPQTGTTSPSVKRVVKAKGRDLERQVPDGQ